MELQISIITPEFITNNKPISRYEEKMIKYSIEEDICDIVSSIKDQDIKMQEGDIFELYVNVDSKRLYKYLIRFDNIAPGCECGEVFLLQRLFDGSFNPGHTNLIHWYNENLIRHDE